MTSFVSQSVAPCSASIDDVYANAVRAYQREIAELRRRLEECDACVTEHEQTAKSLSASCEAKDRECAYLQEKSTDLERINHHVSRRLNAAREARPMFSCSYAQTDDDEYIRICGDNKSLKGQIRQLLAISQESLTRQQALVVKCESRTSKISELRRSIDELSGDLSKTRGRVEDVDGKVEELVSRNEWLTTDNRRIAVRLAETEGNVVESESTNARLRRIVNGKRDHTNTENITAMNKKLERNHEKCLRLTESLRETQEFLDGSKNQLVVANEREQGRYLADAELVERLRKVEARNTELERALVHGHCPEHESLSISDQLEYILNENDKLWQHISEIEKASGSPARLGQRDNAVSERLHARIKENDALVRRVEELLTETFADSL